MVRTQIQLPTELYERAKRVADGREISMAELMRRGLETILAQYPMPDTPKTWSLPQANVGKILVPLEKLGEYTHGDEEVRSLVAEDLDE